MNFLRELLVFRASKNFGEEVWRHLGRKVNFFFLKIGNAVISRLPTFILLLLCFSRPAFAEACPDPEGAVDSESGKITDNGFSLELQSLVFPADDGMSYIVYCVRNKHGTKRTQIKWDGPKPDVLAEFPVASQNERPSEKGEKFSGEPVRSGRDVHYGRRSSDTYVARDIDTLLRAGLNVELDFVPAQATSLSTVPSLHTVMGDVNGQALYFDAYAADPSGGNLFTTGGYLNFWVPNSREAISAIANDEEYDEGGDGEYRQVSLRAVSELDIAEGVRSWRIELATRAADGSELFLVNDAAFTDGLSVSFSTNPFPGLAEFSPEVEFKVDPQDFQGAISWSDLSGQTDLQKPLQFDEWSAAVLYEGLPIAGFGFQTLSNQ